MLIANSIFNFHLRIILLLMLITLSSQSYGRTYIVETIVFSNEGTSGQSEEIWDATTARTTKKKNEIYTLYDAAQPARQAFGLSRLKPILNKLYNSPEHKVLLSSSWTQSEASYANSQLTRVSAINLLGSVRIYAPNLLFADINLQFSPDPPFGQSSISSPKYFLIEKRKLKLNETHYFDHPMFGVILNVRPAR